MGLESRWDLVTSRIGTAAAEKHRNIAALLMLADYRMEDMEDLTYGLSRMFLYDTLYGKKPSTRAIAGALSPLLWLACRIAHRKVPAAPRRILFSNTFLLSARYPAARAQIDRECGCTAVLAFSDLLKREGREQRLALKQSLRIEKQQVRPVFFPGRSICGRRLERAVENYCRLLYGAPPQTAPEIEAALTELESAYLARLEKIESALRKADCELYLTVNQYNLRDLLLIHACRNLGIRTVQQEHHATSFNRVQFDETAPAPRLAFAGEYGFWSEGEKRFHEKVYRYENPLYRPEEIRFRVTGNPELSPDRAREQQAKYPPERKLTFMIAAWQPEWLEGFEKEYEAWRRAIWEGLRELSRRQNVRINIRYTPGEETALRAKEEPLMKEWGFTVSASVPANMMEDLCSSAVIMSSTSSVLETARLFGKLIYRVEDPQIRYVHADEAIHEVRVADIPEIVIPEGIEHLPPRILEEDCFDINRII